MPMKRRGVLCGVGGVAVLVVCLLATCSWPVEAQPPGSAPPADPVPTPAPAASWNQPGWASPVAGWAPVTLAPAAGPVPVPRSSLPPGWEAYSIDDLLGV